MINGILYAYYKLDKVNEENFVFINVQNQLPGCSYEESENKLVSTICFIENYECRYKGYLNINVVENPIQVEDIEEPNMLRVKDFPQIFLLYAAIKDDETGTIYFRKDKFADLVKKYIKEKGYVLINMKATIPTT